MIYICSKQGKIDKLWGRFIKHLIELQEAGIKVEYVRKGEVILDGKRYEPMYMENTMSWEPLDKKEKYISCTGYNIQPLIDYLKSKKKQTNGDLIRSMSDEALADAMLEVESSSEKIPFCKNSNRCDEIMDTGESIPDSMCKQCLMEWLERERYGKNSVQSS